MPKPFSLNSAGASRRQAAPTIASPCLFRPRGEKPSPRRSFSFARCSQSHRPRLARSRRVAMPGQAKARARAPPPRAVEPQRPGNGTPSDAAVPAGGPPRRRSPPLSPVMSCLFSAVGSRRQCLLSCQEARNPPRSSSRAMANWFDRTSSTERSWVRSRLFSPLRSFRVCMSVGPGPWFNARWAWVCVFYLLLQLFCFVSECFWSISI